MPESISSDIISALYFILTGLFMLPLTVMIFWKILKKGKFLPFIFGIVTYFFFGQLLNSLPQSWLASGGNPVFDYLLARPILYVLVSGIIEAVFVEFGRFFALGICMKNTYKDRRDGVSFGIGMGFTEALLSVILSVFMYVAMATALNEAGSALAFLGSFEADAHEDLIDMITYVASLTTMDCVYTAINAICGMLVQIALSILMFSAAQTESKRNYFHLCVGLHLLVNLPLLLRQADVIHGMIAPTCCFAVLTALLLIYAYREYSTQYEKKVFSPIVNSRLRR